MNNNFIPSSNLSSFLLNKGSSGSLRNFENEYNYKINLESLGGGGHTVGQNANSSKISNY